MILFFLCSRENSATLNALAQDHRNDVFSNIMALLCGTLGRIYIFYIDLIQFYFLLKVILQKKSQCTFLRR
jgi:divalent metal cation (Fe/Co/Zn/Cd) transporter